MAVAAMPSRRLLDRLSRANAAAATAWARTVHTRDAAQWAIALADDVPRQSRIDLGRGQRLAGTARLLADRSRDRLARGRALRAEGHGLALGSRFRLALARYTDAIAQFDAEGDRLQKAITYSGAIHTLVHLGRYDKAERWARRARAIFRRRDDDLRLARLESNVGNLHFRQDRFKQALACYRRAESALRAHDQHQDAAEAMRNIAVCLTSLNAFDDALEAYAKVRMFSETHALTMLVAAADYNIAYLHFLCGRYTQALTAYAVARARSEELGDRYHRALCDMDEAEVCLELNDLPGARRLAEAAARGFTALGLRYERAKSLVFLATALARHGDGVAALATFARARALYQADRNQPWLATVDLGRAIVCSQLGRDAQARRLMAGAERRPMSPSTRVRWQVLRTRIALRRGDLREAARGARAAEAALAQVRVSSLAWQVDLVCGEVAEARGDTSAAEASLTRARQALERLRAQIAAEDLKAPFLGDKLAVYEGLIRLAIGRHDSSRREAETFRLIEDAKSRGLVELLAFRASELTPRAAGTHTPDLVGPLRQQLHACQRRMAQAVMQSSLDDERLRQMRAAADGRERQLSAALSRLGESDGGLASLHTGTSASLADIQDALPPDTMLLEFFVARDQIYACVVGPDLVRVSPLAATTTQVTRTLQLLRFQLAKFQLGPDYVRTFASVLSAATRRHLRELYDQLVAPVRPLLRAEHLVVVPHGVLHYLPFHALEDAGGALIDAYAISYAPSASVFRLCQIRPPSPHHDSLVLALADGFAPHIGDEATQVAQCLPAPTLRTGTMATRACLRELGAVSRYVHIATHGYFRRDNPMLSSIRLADGDLSLADTYGLTLDADLVTLSGCGTGLSAVMGGDELVGLMRGFLYAGARSLLLTMWQVDDLSTAEFMAAFYANLAQGQPTGVAVQTAMRSLRARFPHPYHWAPFTLVGQATGRAAALPTKAPTPRGRRKNTAMPIFPGRTRALYNQQ
ncbi:MAG: CHAT domain-containing tetratricopeptide repeat protein [Vicinamibacterales bacterium]